MGTRLSKNIVFVVVAWLYCGMCLSCTCGNKEAPGETKSPPPAVTPNQAPAPDAAAPGGPQPETTAATATPGNQAPASASTSELTTVPEVSPEELADPQMEGLPERTKYVLKALKKAQQRMPAPQVRAQERTSPPRNDTLAPPQ